MTILDRNQAALPSHHQWELFNSCPVTISARGDDFAMADTRRALWQMTSRGPAVAVDQVHLRDAVRLLVEVNTDPGCPIEVWSDERGLNIMWGNAIARLPATEWLIGRFEAEAAVFLRRLTFTSRVRSRPVCVWYSGRDDLVFGRTRIPGVRYAD